MLVLAKPAAYQTQNTKATIQYLDLRDSSMSLNGKRNKKTRTDNKPARVDEKTGFKKLVLLF